MERIVAWLFVLFSTVALPGAVLAQGGRMDEYPRSPDDRRIDALGCADCIHSPREALDYAGAVLEKFGLGKVQFPGLDGIRDRLAAAEYAAVVDPSRRIHESNIVQTFNRMMDEWQTPGWARTSAREVHHLRLGIAKVFLPHIVARSPDGEILDEIRPVEAVYLLWLLEFNRPTSTGRSQEDTNNLAPSAAPLSKGTPQFLPYRPSQAQIQREREYLQARDRYFTQHSKADLAIKVQELLKNLNVD